MTKEKYISRVQLYKFFAIGTTIIGLITLVDYFFGLEIINSINSMFGYMPVLQSGLLVEAVVELIVAFITVLLIVISLRVAKKECK